MFISIKTYLNFLEREKYKNNNYTGYTSSDILLILSPDFGTIIYTKQIPW